MGFASPAEAQMEPAFQILLECLQTLCPQALAVGEEAERTKRPNIMWGVIACAEASMYARRVGDRWQYAVSSSRSFPAGARAQPTRHSDPPVPAASTYCLRPASGRG